MIFDFAFVHRKLPFARLLIFVIDLVFLHSISSFVYFPLKWKLKFREKKNVCVTEFQSKQRFCYKYIIKLNFGHTSNSVNKFQNQSENFDTNEHVSCEKNLPCTCYQIKSEFVVCSSHTVVMCLCWRTFDTFKLISVPIFYCLKNINVVYRIFVIL